jgi:hypothetical protein
MTTQADAIDEMYGMVKTAWETSCQSIFGYVGEVRWPGAEKATKPEDTLQVWARPSHRIVKDDQSAINAKDGQRFYTAIGVLFVEVYIPRSVSGALDKGRLLAIAVRDKFRQSPASSEIRFRDQKVVDIAPTPQYYSVHAVVTFEFDTIQ